MIIRCALNPEKPINMTLIILYPVITLLQDAVADMDGVRDGDDRLAVSISQRGYV